MSGAAMHSSDRASRRRDVVVASACGAFVAAMIGAAYGSVPLYDWFCRTTGFGGTTQVSTVTPSQVLGRTITVRFDANVAPGLPWRFVPETNSIDVRIGEVLTLNYVVTNLAARDTVGQASYNVTPPTTGAYFQKINCFCFTEQTMKAGETREMPVVFYVDPALAQHSEQNGLNTITLSYTYFPVRRPEPLAGTQGRRAD
jgi:cytochrome c oxidase assembly protein subunit 11